MTLIESERRAEVYANLAWLGMRWDTKGGGWQGIADIAVIGKGRTLPRINTDNRDREGIGKT
jgi:hypothetical protein